MTSPLVVRMDQLSEQNAAMDALRRLVGIFIWYPADESSPEYPIEPVTEIDLGDTSITDDALAHLTHFGSLEWLCLENTSVTDAGLRHIAGLKSLRELILVKTETTVAGVNALKRELPDCEIQQ